MFWRNVLLVVAIVLVLLVLARTYYRRTYCHGGPLSVPPSGLVAPHEEADLQHDITAPTATEETDLPNDIVEEELAPVSKDSDVMSQVPTRDAGTNGQDPGANGSAASQSYRDWSKRRCCGNLNTTWNDATGCVARPLDGRPYRDRSSSEHCPLTGRRRGSRDSSRRRLLRRRRRRRQSQLAGWFGDDDDDWWEEEDGPRATCRAKDSEAECCAEADCRWSQDSQKCQVMPGVLQGDHYRERTSGQVCDVMSVRRVRAERACYPKKKAEECNADPQCQYDETRGYCAAQPLSRAATSMTINVEQGTVSQELEVNGEKVTVTGKKAAVELVEKAAVTPVIQAPAAKDLESLPRVTRALRSSS